MKLYKNFAQKLLAVSLCAAMVLLGVPVTTFAADTPTKLDVAVSVEGKEATIECTLTDEEGKLLDGQEISITVTGPDGSEIVSETAYTDESGLAMSYPTLGPAGSYRVVATFAGGDGYDGSEVSTDFYLWGVTLKDEKGAAIEADSTVYRAVEVGDRLTFSAEVDSGAETNNGVTWSVTGKDIATIDATAGELTVKAIGSVWVTATSNDDESVYAEFYLQLREPVPVSGVKIFDWLGTDVTGGSATLAVSRGVDVGLSAEVSSDGGTPQGVTWSSSDESIVGFDEWGHLVVTGFGTVKVTATSLDDPSKSATVTVLVAPPSTAVTGRGEPHSVALLTLTATGKTGEDEDELTADMTWKTFIPGTTVDLELKFVMPDGSVAGQVNLMDWVAAYGDMSHTDPGFVDFAPSAWCLAAVGGLHGAWNAFALSSFSPETYGVSLLKVEWDGHFDVLSMFGCLCASVNLAPPLIVGASLRVPGLARLSPGGALAFDTSWFGVGWESVDSYTSSDPSVAVYENGSIKGLSAGTATLTFKFRDVFCGTIEVAVGDWVPPHTVPAGLAAVAGTRLGDVPLPEADAAGTWAWVHPDDRLTQTGTTTHKALYTPTDTDNYGSVVVDVPVEVYLEKTVTVSGKTQRLRVYDPNSVLPAGTELTAEYVDDAHGDHNFFITHLDPATDVELQHFYNLTLTSAGRNLSELDGPVELWFEAINGIDAADSFVSRVAEGADAKLTPTLYTDDDGVTWIKVLTDHFSPYALTDLLSKDEKAALTQENSAPKNNVKTGDHAAQLAVAGLGMVLVLALGIMLRLITSKKKFEE